jgi:hypothetical protein
VPAPPTKPPYALEATPFRFPGLASLAGRAPLGGQREVALATYVAARLAHDVLPNRGVSQATRVERAAHARTWLANMALPANVRPALVKLVDASGGSANEVAKALRVAIDAATSFLNGPARSELDQLAKSLDAEPLPS